MQIVFVRALKTLGMICMWQWLFALFAKRNDTWTWVQWHKQLFRTPHFANGFVVLHFQNKKCWRALVPEWIISVILLYIYLFTHRIFHFWSGGNASEMWISLPVWCVRARARPRWVNRSRIGRLPNRCWYFLLSVSTLFSNCDTRHSFKINNRENVCVKIEIHFHSKKVLFLFVRIFFCFELQISDTTKSCYLWQFNWFLVGGTKSKWWNCSRRD